MMQRAPWIVWLLLVVGLGSAVPLPSGAGPVAPKVLTYVLAQEPTSMDPAVAVDSQSGLSIRNVYDRLIEVSPDGRRLTPGLAERWEVSSDGLTYTFHLRSDVRFHSGAPLTAEAARFSLERALAIGKGDSSKIKNFIETRNIRATGPRTLQIRLTLPYAPILSILGFWNIGSVVNPEFVRANATADDPWAVNTLSTRMDGTGPFRFVEWQPKQFVAVERNQNYWRGPAKLDRIIFRLGGEPATTRFMLERGEVDIVHLLPTDMVAALGLNPEVVIASRPGLETTYWPFNNEMAPFNDVRVRQALSYAIDYDAILTNIIRRSGIGMRGPIPQALPGFDETIAMPRRDVARAKALLAEAGFPNGFNTVTHYPVWRDLASVAVVLQANLAEVGVKLELREVPLPTLVDVVVRGTSPFFPWVSTPTYGDPDAVMYFKFHSSAIPLGAAGNIARYKNPRVDQLLDQARAIPDQGRRVMIYREVSRIVVRDAPWLFLYQTVNQQPVRRWVQGYEIPVIGVPNFWGVDAIK